jgi:hypothetical protein
MQVSMILPSSRCPPGTGFAKVPARNPGPPAPARGCPASWSFHARRRTGHETDFIFEGRLAEGGIVPPGGGTHAGDGEPIEVRWRPAGDAGLAGPLFPDGAGELMRRHRS